MSDDAEKPKEKAKPTHVHLELVPIETKVKMDFGKGEATIKSENAEQCSKSS